MSEGGGQPTLNKRILTLRLKADDNTYSLGTMFLNIFTQHVCKTELGRTQGHLM
jgi:hypothetical protein